MIRGRFAPTPSGELHIGNLYAALLAWLQVRNAGGQFVLRLEDLDEPRCKPEWVSLLLEDLQWFGLDWDEGPDVGGPYGPYRQKDRISRYEAAIAELDRLGFIYPCFCSRAELMSMALAPHGLATEGPEYRGTCRRLSREEQERKAAVKKPSFRFAVPWDGNREIAFTDGVAGYVTFPQGFGGDFVVRRADGIIGYQLAVVVDDATMGITDVLRGADLIDSTPRQLWLYAALGFKAPTFAHVPLLCDNEGNRLSKRHKSLSAAAMRRQGVRPEKIVGLIAYLSGLIDRPEDVQPKELVSTYRLNKLPRRPIRLPKEWFRDLL